MIFKNNSDGLSRIFLEIIIITIILTICFLNIRIETPKAEAYPNQDINLKHREIRALEDISATLKRIEVTSRRKKCN